MPSAKNYTSVLTFTLLDSHICMDVSYINKVLPLLMLETVPNATPALAGLMNIEGQISPVIDLAIYLGMQRKLPYSLDTPILYCNYENHSAGLIVDTIIGLRNIELQKLQTLQASDATTAAFLGSMNIDTYVTLLINVAALFPINY